MQNYNIRHCSALLGVIHIYFKEKKSNLIKNNSHHDPVSGGKHLETFEKSIMSKLYFVPKTKSPISGMNKMNQV